MKKKYRSTDFISSNDEKVEIFRSWIARCGAGHLVNPSCDMILAILGRSSRVSSIREKALDLIRKHTLKAIVPKKITCSINLLKGEWAKLDDHVISKGLTRSEFISGVIELL